MMKTDARRIVEALLEEDTIIVVNNGGDGKESVRQVVGSDAGAPTEAPVKAKGPYWNFAIERDADGRITNVKASQM
jgi:hypothetical protein